MVGNQLAHHGLPAATLVRISFGAAPQPVSVTRARTGKLALGSGSEPQLGLPPGPPVALTLGRCLG